ncbi:cofactor-independent phosphoglycerate mutase [bacterium]|nr:cofactor-independent phosphoglycerate mutase [bacterium]
MKYLVILGDGMADRPMERLNGKTPLMVANKPHIDEIAKKGRAGKVMTIPDDMPTGSAVANLSVLGYDSHKYFSGRGALEAANIGIDLEPDDLVFRFNLMTLFDDGKIKNHSAGHISTAEADKLVKALNRELGSDIVSFYTGISYKHILVIKNGNNDIECFPPHDYPGTLYTDVLAKSTAKDGVKTAALVNELIEKSHAILKNHPVNLERKKSGKDVANTIWPWSPGKKPVMPSFKELTGLKGAIISAVDLIKGIGVYAKMEVVEVEGATGLYDTNYEGKAAAAIEALKRNDFVYLHVEATDEAGHEGDVDLKIKCIEYLDARITKYILENKDSLDEPLTIAVLPDHPTPAELRIHTREAVPFVIYNPSLEADEVTRYDEDAVDKGILGTIEGPDFIKLLIGS